MTKYIFLDTNVFLECLLFTEIDWREIPKDSQKLDKIIIVIPYKVNEELDNLKRYEKKARNVQKRLRKLKDVEFKEGITLNITVFPINWSSLKSEWAEKLDENKVYKMAKDFWANHLKNIMTWDDYYDQIKEQIKIYIALPQEDKPKFMNMLNNRVQRTDREIQKMKQDKAFYKNKKGLR